MKYEWKKELIEGKWYSVCSNAEHVPMIEHCKDETYKVIGSDGKSRIEKEYKDAQKFAIQTFKRMSKFNRKWNKENENN